MCERACVRVYVSVRACVRERAGLSGIVIGRLDGGLWWLNSSYLTYLGWQVIVLKCASEW